MKFLNCFSSIPIVLFAFKCCSALEFDEFDYEKEYCGLPFDPFDLFPTSWTQFKVKGEYRRAVVDYPNVGDIRRTWYDTAYAIVSDEQRRYKFLACMENRFLQLGLVYPDAFDDRNTDQFELFKIRSLDDFPMVSTEGALIAITVCLGSFVGLVVVTVGCRLNFIMGKPVSHHQLPNQDSESQRPIYNWDQQQQQQQHSLAADIEEMRRMQEAFAIMFQQMQAEREFYQAQRIEEFRRNIIYEDVHHVANMNAFATMMGPLSAVDIEALSKCVICLAEFDVGETGCMRVNACGHFFHYESCLKPWLVDYSEANPTCPICRVQPESDRLVLRTRQLPLLSDCFMV